VISTAPVSSAPDDRRFVISSWLFGRALGAVLLVAFVSLGVQAKGLFGAGGVTPISMFVQSATSAGHSFWQHPSALWWSHGDTMIAATSPSCCSTIGSSSSSCSWITWRKWTIPNFATCRENPARSVNMIAHSWPNRSQIR